MGKKQTKYTAKEKIRHKTSKDLHRLVKKLKTFQIQKCIKAGNLEKVKVLKTMQLPAIVDGLLSVTLQEKQIDEINQDIRDMVQMFLKTKQIAFLLENIQKELVNLSAAPEPALTKPKVVKKKAALIGGRSCKEPVSLFLTSLNGKHRYQEEFENRKETEEQHVATTVGEIAKKKNRPGQRARRAERALNYRKEQQQPTKSKKKQQRVPPTTVAPSVTHRPERAQADKSSHPSWQAKQNLKDKESNIHVFSGKKITF